MNLYRKGIFFVLLILTTFMMFFSLKGLLNENKRQAIDEVENKIEENSIYQELVDKSIKGEEEIIRKNKTRDFILFNDTGKNVIFIRAEDGDIDKNKPFNPDNKDFSLTKN